MFENIINFFKKFSKENNKDSKDTAKERLHLVLMQDRANVSADFLEMMKQEIIEVIKKYINVDENSIDVKLTNKVNADGTTGAPALYANIPIVSLKDETKKINIERQKEEKKQEKEKVQKENEVEDKSTELEATENTENNDKKNVKIEKEVEPEEEKIEVVEEMNQEETTEQAEIIEENKDIEDMNKENENEETKMKEAVEEKN